MCRLTPGTKLENKASHQYSSSYHSATNLGQKEEESMPRVTKQGADAQTVPRPSARNAPRSAATLSR